MADPSSPLQFEDVPLDEARRMGRGGPRMEPMLYETLRQKIQSLSTEEIRIHLGPEIRPQRMKRYLQAIARELNVPVTIRRVPALGTVPSQSISLSAALAPRTIPIDTPPQSLYTRATHLWQ
jgi:hypothetical protein